jgi:hypothetical protein
MCHRTGVGRVKHLDVRFLLVQLLLRQKQFEIRRVPGTANPSDLLTKNVSREVLERLRSGLYPKENSNVGALLRTKRQKRRAGLENTVLHTSALWARVLWKV